MFYTRRNTDTGELYIDSLIDVTPCISPAIKGKLAYKKLTGKPPSLTDPVPNAIAADIFAMEMRARMNSMNGPYLVLTESVLTREELDMYLKSLTPQELEAFFKKAMV